MSKQTTLHQPEMDKQVCIKVCSDHHEEKVENHLFWGTRPAQSLEYATLNPGIVSLSATLGIELT